jgi:hypothetical protein
MQRAPQKELFFEMIDAETTSPLFPYDVLQWVQQTHKPEKLRTIYNYGMKRILDYLERGESPDFDHGNRARYEDAALAHVFWYPLDEFTEREYQIVLKHLQNLQRDSGVLRYQNDLYLHSLYYFGRQGGTEMIPSEFLEANRSLTTGELWEIFHPRQPERAAELFGKDLESQWSIHNSILAYGALFLYEKF